MGDCFAVGYYRQHAQWKRLWSLFPYVLAGMIPGWFVLLWAEDQQFRLVLGWMVLALLALELGRRVSAGTTSTRSGGSPRCWACWPDSARWSATPPDR